MYCSAQSCPILKERIRDQSTEGLTVSVFSSYTTPLQVTGAVGVEPTSSDFKSDIMYALYWVSKL